MMFAFEVLTWFFLGFGLGTLTAAMAGPPRLDLDEMGRAGAFAALAGGLLGIPFDSPALAFHGFSIFSLCLAVASAGVVLVAKWNARVDPS